MKGYIAFDPKIRTEETPGHICAYIYKKCDFADQKDANGKVVGCEGKSVSNASMTHVCLLMNIV